MMQTTIGKSGSEEDLGTFSWGGEEWARGLRLSQICATFLVEEEEQNSGPIRMAFES
jgi:hypothetical protein